MFADVYRCSQMFTDVLRRSLNVLRISDDTLVALTGLMGHVGLMGWAALVWVVGFLCLLGMLSRASLTLTESPSKVILLSSMVLFLYA